MKYHKTIFNPHENMMMLESKNNDGSQQHSHEFIELVYIASGKGVHSIRGKSYLLSAGDVFIIHTQDDHALQPLPGSKEPFQWINCLFLPEFYAFDFSVFPAENKYIGTEGFEMNFMFQAMLQEYDEKKPNYLAIINGYLHIIVHKLTRLLADETLQDNYPNRKMRSSLKKTVEYIHQHYQDPVTLQAITSYLMVSPSYIGKVFKEGMGMSPLAYLNRYRIEQSCKLLLETSLPIYQISEEAGFKDMKFFHTVFKRINGLTPGEFRKKYKLCPSEAPRK